LYFNYQVKSRRISKNSPLQAALMKDGCGDFFHGYGSNINIWYVFGKKNRFSRGDFQLALLKGGITAMGAPFGPDPVQTLGFDGETVQFLPEGDQGIGKFVIASEEVFLGEGIIGRIDAELHAKI
jgi:hypothetical protein